jgi:amino acid transporter
MVSTAAVLSVRNLPSMAVEGWPLIFWYVLATVLFLAPLALVAAELASTWPKEGGVYDWVGEAFGARSGFMAVWSIVVQNLPWYPTVLAFVAVSLAFGFDPALENNRPFVVGVMIVTFWALTLIGLRGPAIAARVTSFGTLFGAIVPAVVLILAGIAWMAAGKPLALPPFTFARLLPTWDLGRIPFISSLLLAFTGLEVSGYYALSVRNPQRDYPKAMLLSLLTVAGLSIFATLAIAIAVPVGKISLSGGMVQTFGIVFGAFHIGWLTPVLALLTALGAVAGMLAWLVGPLLSLSSISRHGLLPPIFGKLNARQAPAAIMLWQACIVTVIAAMFALVPKVNDAYWILSATSTVLLTFYYLPIFAAVIRLRYTQPDAVRPFRIPGGVIGVWVVAGSGFLATAFAVFVGLERPTNVTFVSDTVYVVGLVLLSLLWMVPWAVFAIIRRVLPVTPSIGTDVPHQAEIAFGE